MFSQMLVKIDQIVNKWQQFFEIHDGGGRHLELWLRRFFDVTDVFWIKVAISPVNLAMIGQIVTEWQPFFKIQDGGDRDRECIYKMHFRRHWYVLNQSPIVATNFGDDRSNTKEMAAVFRNPSWRQPPSWKVPFRLNHYHKKWIPCL